VHFFGQNLQSKVDFVTFLNWNSIKFWRYRPTVSKMYWNLMYVAFLNWNSIKLWRYRPTVSKMYWNLMYVAFLSRTLTKSYQNIENTKKTKTMYVAFLSRILTKHYQNLAKNIKTTKNWPINSQWTPTRLRPGGDWDSRPGSS
jgi:hypothetical protein